MSEGATLGLASTTTPVDIDQFFNTFPPSVRRGLGEFVQGNAAIYAGRGKDANQTYKYFGPALNRTSAFVHELTADQNLFTRFIVSSSKLATVVSERGNQLSSAVSNASHAFGAIASQNVALDSTLQELPPVLRQSNTTFVNLRAALDDLEPLVNTAKPATKNLAPFLEELRPVVNTAIPVFKNLRLTVHRPGPANDAADLFAALPPVQQLAAKAFPNAQDAITAFQPTLNFARALHARHLQRLRQAGNRLWLLRRQRQLRPGGNRRSESFCRQGRQARTDQAEPAVRSVRLLRRHTPTLSRWRHPIGPR